ncbi:hypothetical protein ACFVIN_33165 [Streptomyces prasinus]|uniref:hypothetical protein n=1 Tax=Streptomyces prasinus TaxID=67345 RepID=UPI0036307F59
MNDQSGTTCSACRGWMFAGQQPGYDHIHAIPSLPDDSRNTDTHHVMCGYAVGFSNTEWGGLPQTWVFFEDLEPAIVFGRAGRMSMHDISGYGVYTAAREVRFDPAESDDEITTLYLSGRPLDRRPGEKEIFARWARGVQLKSAYYEPPWLGH